MMEKDRVKLGGRLGDYRNMTRCVDVIEHVEVEMMAVVEGSEANLEVEKTAAVGRFGVVQRVVEMKVVEECFVDGEKLPIRRNMACLVKSEDSQVIVAVDLVR